jgi:glycolate oxidase FAD binding subunit
VKNVAGYDMPKLYIGSLGTLGVIVEASLKVAPLPQAEATWLARPGKGVTSAEAVSFALEVHSKGLRLRALAVVRDGAPFADIAGGEVCVAAWVAGTESAVDRSLRELDALVLSGKDAGLEARRLEAAEGARLWEAVRVSCRPLSGDEAVVRASFLPSQAAALLSEMEALNPVSIVAYPAAGIAYGRFDAAALGTEAVARLRRAVPPERGGAVVVEACPRSLKEHIDIFGDPQEDFPLMRRLKEQMDPLGLLNRGRFLGRL